MSSFIEPSPVRALNGFEAILPGVTVRDLWAWAMGDLRLNRNRGALAQFLVAKAVGDTTAVDVGWDDYDVLSPEGIKIEVKSSAYLQSWSQKQHSKIVFTGLVGKPYSEETGRGSVSTVRADVFVFAVNTCREPSGYDPLRLAD